MHGYLRQSLSLGTLGAETRALVPGGEPLWDFIGSPGGNTAEENGACLQGTGRGKEQRADAFQLPSQTSSRKCQLPKRDGYVHVHDMV